MNNFKFSIKDKQLSDDALQYIIDDKLNQAWKSINQIESIDLKSNIINFSYTENTSIQSRVKYDTFYKGCDGNWHSSPDDDGGSGNGGSGSECCYGICCIIISICCSISIKKCCFCAIWDLIKDIYNFCN